MDSEAPDQTAQLCRLIGVFSGYIYLKAHCLTLRLRYINFTLLQATVSRQGFLAKKAAWIF